SPVAPPRPFLHLLAQSPFLLGRLAEQSAGGVPGVGGGLVVLAVVGVVLLDAVQFPLEDTEGRAGLAPGAPGRVQRLLVPFQGGGAGGGAGGEALSQRD